MGIRLDGVMMRNKNFLVFCLLFAFSFAVLAGTEMKINNAKIDASTDPPTLTLKGVNFAAFGQLTVSMGSSILNAGLCVVEPETITCSLDGVPVNSGETWTVSISAGNAPGKNEEIEVAIPFDTAPSMCIEGKQDGCYTGPSGTLNVGLCAAGLSTCTNGEYGACEGEVIPAASDQCGDGLDNDCNGATDESCGCVLNPTACDDGKSCTEDICTPDETATGYSCSHSINTGHCLINGVCYADGEASPGGCGICDSASSSTSWTFLSSATMCRAVASDCDIAEYCSGSSADCPYNSVQPMGTSCGSGTCMSCNSSGSCSLTPSSSDDCGGYNCAGFGVCATSCSGGQGCAAGYACLISVCVGGL